MNKINPQVDLYIADGCGRCKYYATDLCKVRSRQAELETIRQTVLGCGLDEELKWGVPVYTYLGNNVVIISALKDCATLGFFKGVLLKDQNKILIQQGKNSQSARIIKFSNVEEIVKLAPILKEYIKEAKKLEESGAKVVFSKNPEAFPLELETKFEEMPALKNAFYALTPGRQRAYIIHFSQAKQSQTRMSRIEKNVGKIMNGEGLNDKYSC